MKYKVGDKVRIVSQPTPNFNDGGLMDKYLSTVMTVRKFIGDAYRMEEGYEDFNRSQGWCWREGDIEGLASPIRKRKQQ